MTRLTTPADPKLQALFTHWLTADAVNHHLRRSMKMPADGDAGIPDALLPLASAMSGFYVVSVWYALLYVVIEGYQELKLHDAEVDPFLAQADYVGALRRFRNATFHYQGDPVPKKVMEFLMAPESELWIRRLNRAFDRFFTRELNIKEDVESWKSLDPSVFAPPK